MSDDDMVVTACNSHAAAEDAVRQLRKSGYDITKLSIVVKDYCHVEQRIVGFYSAGDRIRHWGKYGVLWGGALGLLFGAALFVLPDIGPSTWLQK